MIGAVKLTHALRSLSYRLEDRSFKAISALETDDGIVEATSIRRALTTIDSRVNSESRVTMANQLAVALSIELDGPVSEEQLVRVLVVTALGLEFSEVLAHIDSPSKLMLTSTLRASAGRAKSGNIYCAVISTGQGNANAAQMVAAAVTAFNPDLVVLVGVAGALKDGMEGDVVFAESIYQLGHVSESEHGTFSREKSIPCDPLAIQTARQLYSSSKTVIIGPIVSGDRLVKTTKAQTADWIRQNMNDAQALEMEGWGVASAASGARKPLIVVRGISDRLDNKSAATDSVAQPAAASNAARIAFDVVYEMYDVSRAPLALKTSKESTK